MKTAEKSSDELGKSRVEKRTPLLILATMSVSAASHPADFIIYWKSSPSDEYAIEPLEEDGKPGCDWDRPYWDALIQKWRKHELACLWLCERHAAESGFIWRAGAAAASPSK
jgi:hypothetical protein